uniref:Uncharacterized protein n=1 Tax=viral metagenome TaxID=1070528 RepID=A0A6M3III3_9ZZZZ
MYKAEIIHFIGGLTEFVGELDQSEHPNGLNWYRIRNPCIIFTRENKEMKRIDTVVALLSGPQKVYRKFVDIRIPEDSILEIRVLDKNGALYEHYSKEVNRIMPEKIILPEHGIAVAH